MQESNNNADNTSKDPHYGPFSGNTGYTGVTYLHIGLGVQGLRSRFKGLELRAKGLGLGVSGDLPWKCSETSRNHKYARGH